MDYREAVDYFLEIPKFADKKHDPEDLRVFLKELGDPQEQICLLHVAGTNGKGSVCAFLTSLLVTAGYHCGTFVSPHLVTVNERFILDGQVIDDSTYEKAVAQVLQVVKTLQGQGMTHPTFFEFAFLIFMVICRDAKVSHAVLETGMGGRLDATNVIQHPAVTVITSISKDHVEYLGDTIPKIAAEKAGIIKTGAPVVYDNSDQEAARVICDRASQLDVMSYGIGRESCTIQSMKGSGMEITCHTKAFEGLSLFVPFCAEYQAINCMLAVEAFSLLPGEASRDTGMIRQAIAATKWPGRMEQVLDGVYLDGAHNQGGIHAFVEAAARIAGQTQGKIYLLIAVVSDKDYEAMVSTLVQEVPFDALFVTQVSSYRALDAQLLEHTAEQLTDRPVYEYDTVRESIEKALQRKEKQDVLFCVGSLYLIGEIKEILEEKEHDKL